jgi:hypothetical protein
MHRESSEPRAGDRRQLERAIVLELLGDDDGDRRPEAQLADDLGCEQDLLSEALRSLIEAGVLHAEQQAVWVSAAARRLDQLELIGI